MGDVPSVQRSYARRRRAFTLMGKKQRSPVGASAHDSHTARLVALSKQLERKDKKPHSTEALRCRLQLADGCMMAYQWKRAAEVCSRAMELDTCDTLGARRLLAPLLIRLGHFEEATARLTLASRRLGGHDALRAVDLPRGLDPRSWL